VRIWNVASGTSRVLNGHAARVYSVCAMPDGRLASGSWDNTVRIWNLSGTSHVLNGHTANVNSVCALPDGRLASGSTDRTVRIWDVSPRRPRPAGSEAFWPPPADLVQPRINNRNLPYRNIRRGTKTVDGITINQDNVMIDWTVSPEGAHEPYTNYNRQRYHKSGSPPGTQGPEGRPGTGALYKARLVGGTHKRRTTNKKKNRKRTRRSCKT
jgi:WD40 repeat protein